MRALVRGAIWVVIGRLFLLDAVCAGWSSKDPPPPPPPTGKEFPNAYICSVTCFSDTLQTGPSGTSAVCIGNFFNSNLSGGPPFDATQWDQIIRDDCDGRVARAAAKSVNLNNAVCDTVCSAAPELSDTTFTSFAHQQCNGPCPGVSCDNCSIQGTCESLPCTPSGAADPDWNTATQSSHTTIRLDHSRSIVAFTAGDLAGATNVVGDVLIFSGECSGGLRRDHDPQSSAR